MEIKWSLFLYFALHLIPFALGRPLCSSHDSFALLHFKQSLAVTDTTTTDDIWYHCDSSLPLKTMSWNRSDDCCTWDGVTCDNFTGRVIGLDLSCSKLEGTIHPNSSLFQLSHITTLNLSFINFLDLTLLYLGPNNLSGEVGAVTFSSMTNLDYLDLSYSGLSWSSNGDNINITFPHLHLLALASCGFKFFPDFILHFKELEVLDLSGNEIHGTFPIWFEGLRSLIFLNLSHNYLTSLDYLPWHSMNTVDLQSNSLTGPIPSSLCKPNDLSLLDLSYNNLSSKIPDCLFISEYPSVLNLRGNNINGPIPDIFPARKRLYHIDVSKNQLEGPMPRSLVNCTSLRVLDLGNNKINDTFPTWLEALQELEVLNLKSNRFYGDIVAHQSNFPFQNLRIFDISNNSFAGSLPIKILEGFKAMMNTYAKDPNPEYMEVEPHYNDSAFDWPVEESVVLVMKNHEVEFKKILKIFTSIDLSRNKFEGEIPKSIGNLTSLLLLNLSHNSLTGTIPIEMKGMSTLEALDLSSNQLTGKIPVELASLTFLGVLNLSHNHLVGPIPRGNQFNTFSNDSYLGNRDLCGFPLSNECGNMGAPPVLLVEQEDESSLFSEFT